MIPSSTTTTYDPAAEAELLAGLEKSWNHYNAREIHARNV
jgi:hypothetical protein